MNLVRSDMYRVFKSVGFKVYLAVVFFTYGITIGYKEPGGITMSSASYDAMALLDSYKVDIQMVGHNGSFYYFFIIPIFVILLADFSTGAVKNSIASVFTKTRYYVLKFVYSISFVLVTFTAFNFLFWVVNKLINGSKYSSDFGDYAKAVLLQLPLCMAISSIFILLAFIIRKAAIFNAVTILLPYFYTITDVFFDVIAKLPKVSELMNKAYYDSVFYTLVAEPSGEYIAKVYAVCGGIVAVSFVAGLQVFRKREVG